MKWHPTQTHILASGCLGSKLIIWDVRNERAYKYTFLGNNQSIDSIDFHPTFYSFLSVTRRRNILVATCYDSVFLWDYEVELFDRAHN